MRLRLPCTVLYCVLCADNVTHLDLDIHVWFVGSFCVIKGVV